MNKYYDLMKSLITGFRSSTYEMEQKYKIPGFSAKMSALKNSPNRKLTNHSLSQIEKALDIKIFDVGPNELSFRKLDTIKNTINASAPESIGVLVFEMTMLISEHRKHLDRLQERLNFLYQQEITKNSLPNTQNGTGAVASRSEVPLG